MKTLHVIRHAKSSWDDISLADIDRPLNARGIRACSTMAPEIIDSGCDFAHVFCSPARRAQLTIEGIYQALDRQFDWHNERALYTFSGDALLSWCLQLDDDLDEVVLVSHNPGITELCNELSDQYFDNVPTCGYVQLRCDVERWSKLSAGCASVATFLTPKMLR